MNLVTALGAYSEVSILGCKDSKPIWTDCPQSPGKEAGSLSSENPPVPTAYDDTTIAGSIMGCAWFEGGFVYYLGANSF